MTTSSLLVPDGERVQPRVLSMIDARSPWYKVTDQGALSQPPPRLPPGRTVEFIYVGDPKAGRFHHSTFLSGKPVLCAGEIQVRAGKITYISNESGHYRPSTRDLLSCVGVLQRKYNADLTRMKVADLETKHDWDSASDFLARGGTPPRRGRVIVRAQGAGGT